MRVVYSLFTIRVKRSQTLLNVKFVKIYSSEPLHLTI